MNGIVFVVPGRLCSHSVTKALEEEPMPALVVCPTLTGFSVKGKGASLLHSSEDRGLQESRVLAGRPPPKLSADPKLYPAASPTGSANHWGEEPHRFVVGRASVFIILRTYQRMFKNERVSPLSVKNYLINIRACHVPTISVFYIFHSRAEGW